MTTTAYNYDQMVKQLHANAAALITDNGSDSTLLTVDRKGQGLVKKYRDICRYLTEKYDVPLSKVFECQHCFRSFFAFAGAVLPTAEGHKAVFWQPDGIQDTILVELVTEMRDYIESRRIVDVMPFGDKMARYHHLTNNGGKSFLHYQVPMMLVQNRVMFDSGKLSHKDYNRARADYASRREALRTFFDKLTPAMVMQMDALFARGAIQHLNTSERVISILPHAMSMAKTGRFIEMAALYPNLVTLPNSTLGKTLLMLGPDSSKDASAVCHFWETNTKSERHRRPTKDATKNQLKEALTYMESNGLDRSLPQRVGTTDALPMLWKAPVCYLANHGAVTAGKSLRAFVEEKVAATAGDGTAPVLFIDTGYLIKNLLHKIEAMAIILDVCPPLELTFMSTMVDETAPPIFDYDTEELRQTSALWRYVQPIPLNHLTTVSGRNMITAPEFLVPIRGVVVEGIGLSPMLDHSSRGTEDYPFVRLVMGDLRHPDRAIPCHALFNQIMKPDMYQFRVALENYARNPVDATIPEGKETVVLLPVGGTNARHFISDTFNHRLHVIYKPEFAEEMGGRDGVIRLVPNVSTPVDFEEAKVRLQTSVTDQVVDAVPAAPAAFVTGLSISS